MSYRNVAPSRTPWLLAFLLLAGCSSAEDEGHGSSNPEGAGGGADAGTGDGGDAGSGDGDGGDVIVPDCSPGVWSCEGHLAQACDEDGRFGELRDCSAEGKVCFGDLGCVSCIPGNVRCTDGIAATCNAEGSSYEEPRQCAAEEKRCHPGLGCVTCIPGSSSCVNATTRTCNDTGTGYDESLCDSLQGMVCQPQGCFGGCRPESLGSSHLGCDFYPTITPIAGADERFAFAVTIANDNDEAANIRVTRGEQAVLSTTVEPHSVEVVELPWIEELVGGTQTRLLPQGAYRLRSNRPITVHQHHGTQGSLDPAPEDCTAPCQAKTAASSLLLPAHVLGRSYTVLAWRAFGIGDAFYAITATRYGTLVELEGKEPTLPGSGIDSLGRGQVGMNPGDVLTVFGWSDVSGNRVRSNHPVQVIAGHRCTAVPLALGSHCDHVAEALFPQHAWGHEHFVTAPAAKGHAKQNHSVRIAAREPDTMVTLLGRGFPLGPDDEPLRFSNLTDDVHVMSTKPVLVASFLQVDQPNSDELSGASEAMVIPKEQFRSSYLFVANENHDASFVNVVAKTGSTVLLDGDAIPQASFTAIGSSGYGVARVEILTGGPHTASSDEPFGLVSYGYIGSQSYMHLAGAEVRDLTSP